MSWPTITRARVLARAKQGIDGRGLRRISYSQDRLVTDTTGHQYRTDCSGYVCRVLGLTAADAAAHDADWWGGLNTVSLVTSGALREIKPSELRAGDIVGTCGPGTAGDNGHVAIFGGWDAAAGGDHFHIYEQAGGTVGPIYRTVNWGYVASAYVYAGITDNEEDDMPTAEQLWNWDGIPAPKDSASYAKNKKWTGGNALAEAVRASRSSEKLTRALIAQMDPAGFAAKLAPLLQADGPISQDMLEAALHNVLGSLDND